MTPVRLGTRGSDLARAQSTWVARRLEEAGIACELVIIETDGDANQRDRFAEIGTAGIFVRSIEAALLDQRVDLAVHSYKDLPSLSPPELVIAAVPERADPRDVLLLAETELLPSDARLPVARGARVGTASARRAALLAELRPDVRVTHLRGNVPTRVARLGDDDLDAIILAAAGLGRLRAADCALELEGVHIEPLDPLVFVPAPAQGALAVQTRAADAPLTRRIRDALDHASTRAALLAERRLLALLEGGCEIALGAWCRRPSERAPLELVAAWAAGGRMLRSRAAGQDPESLADALHADLRAQLRATPGTSNDE